MIEPPKCKNCPTGEMLDVWPGSGLGYRESSPCNQYDVCEHVYLERREFCYAAWRTKNPSRAAALDAKMAEQLRHASGHK